MRVALIVNPVSGRHGSRPGAVANAIRTAVRVLESSGVDTHVFTTERPGHATELAAAAVQAGTDIVAAWGGDGTVNEVAASLVGTPTALGILPAGSGSGLARALGIPLHAGRALRVLLEGEPRSIDTGVIDGRTFVNVAGIGFDAHVARAFNAERKGRHGIADYVRITVRELRRYRPNACRLTIGDESFEVSPLIIAFCNSSQYGNGARIAPRASVDDGTLDVVMVRGSTPVRDLLRARRLFTGSLDKDEGTTVRRARSVHVAAAQPIVFHTDGEPRQGAEEFDVRVAPLSLRVMVNRPRR